MNNLKFRAWDNDKKEMFIPSSITSNGQARKIIPCKSDEVIFLGDRRFYEDWDGEKIVNSILMQYTGLKDKNGKEIYVGDICKFVHESYGRTYYGPAVVDYDECNFCLRIPDDPHFNIWLGSKCLENIEVIGNIYQHPELLEANK